MNGEFIMVLQHILDTINDFNTIIIHRHVRPDPDAIGSQGALKEMLQASFPNKQIYAVGEEDPNLDFLVDMDDVGDDMFKQALVIVCDTANTARISDDRYDTGAKLIKIDHHPNHDEYGDIVWVDTEASSTSEMVYQLFLHGKEQGLQMNQEAARLIYAGIIGDTGRFMFANTTNQTFRYAADLIEFDFNRQDLYDELYKISPHAARLRGYILENYKFYAQGIATVCLTKDVLSKHEVTSQEAGKLVGTLADIAGIRIWALFIEEDEKIRASIRSKGPIINEVAATYRGGGHPLAAGASPVTWEETESLTADLQKLL